MLIALKTKWKLILPALLYGIFYVISFIYIENRPVEHMTMIHMTLDDYIPFVEFFVIPYFIWFPYMFAGILYLLWKSPKEYTQLCWFLFIGMTIFLVVSLIWPNGHELRPLTYPRENIFTSIMSFLHRVDTPTNIVPSIHVYNSIGIHIAVRRNADLRTRKWVQISSFLICTAIILSTVLIKQHSIFDAFTAFFMAALLYPLVYHTNLLCPRRMFK